MIDKIDIFKKKKLTPPLLQMINVVAGYKDKIILKNLDLAINAGEIYALLGANGAGKTTTLNLFLGFLKPLSGQVIINGYDVTYQRHQALQQIAYIPENVALYEHLTAQENIDYLLSLAGESASKLEIQQSLIAVGLQESAIHQRVSDFSKGMRQKVAIALAFTRNTLVLLLDEPTSGLDPRATGEFNQLLNLLRKRGVATLMVTHDLLSAVEIADRIGFISSGLLAEEVKANKHAPHFEVNKLHLHYVKWATL